MQTVVNMQVRRVSATAKSEKWWIYNPAVAVHPELTSENNTPPPPAQLIPDTKLFSARACGKQPCSLLPTSSPPPCQHSLEFGSRLILGKSRKNNSAVVLAASQAVVCRGWWSLRQWKIKHHFQTGLLIEIKMSQRIHSKKTKQDFWLPSPLERDAV